MPFYDESTESGKLWSCCLRVNYVNGINSLLSKTTRGINQMQAALPSGDNLKSIAKWKITDTEDKSSVSKMSTQIEASNSIGEVCCIDLPISSSSVNLEPLLFNFPADCNLGKDMTSAIYAADDELQQIIELFKPPEKKMKLPAPSRENLSIVSLGDNGNIYMNNCLVVPIILHTAFQRSSLWGHPGHEETLRKYWDVWWPQIQRDVMLSVKTCRECNEKDKKFRLTTFQTQYGELPSVENVNHEIIIDFVGTNKIATSTKKSLLVSIHAKNGWPEAKN